MLLTKGLKNFFGRTALVRSKIKLVLESGNMKPRAASSFFAHSLVAIIFSQVSVKYALSWIAATPVAEWYDP